MSRFGQAIGILSGFINGDALILLMASSSPINMRRFSDRIDFEGLLDRLDPRALAYLATDNKREIRSRAAEIALRGLR